MLFLFCSLRRRLINSKQQKDDWNISMIATHSRNVCLAFFFLMATIWFRLKLTKALQLLLHEAISVKNLTD